MLTGIYIFNFISYAQDDIPKGGTITVELSEAAAERKPIEGAEIKLISEDGKEYVKKSDATGKYKFTGIPAGRYSLNVTKAGYRDRIKNPLVLAEGGESYQHIKMIKGNIIPRPILVNANADTKRLETLIQHVSKDIGQLYGLDETTLKKLQKSVMDSIKATINKEGSLLKRVYQQASAEGNLGLLVVLLVDPDIKTSFADYLTELQFQSYVDSIKKRRQQVRKAFADTFTLYLDQALSLSPNQREDMSKLLYKWIDGSLYMISNLIFTRTIPETLVEFLYGSTHGSFKQILTDDQYEIWQEIEESAKNLNKNVIVDLIQFDGKEVITKNKEHTLTGTLHIHKLTEAILNLHTEQFQTQNNSHTERFVLVNKGIVEQYLEKLNRIAIKRTSLMMPYSELLFKAVSGQITRNMALEKIKTLKKAYWEDSYANDEKGDDPQVVNPELKQIMRNQMILPNIFNLVKEPIYQQTIKDSISEIEYEKYRKRQSEIETIRLHTIQNLVVAILDMHILLNPIQRKSIEDIAAKLTIPELSRIGLQFMVLELFLNINPDDLSPWQQNALKQGVFLK